MAKFNSLESLSALKNNFSEEDSNLVPDEPKNILDDEVDDTKIKVVTDEVIEGQNETEEKINQVLKEIEAKLPKFEKVENPYIIQMQDLEKSVVSTNYFMINGACYSAVDKKLLGIPYGDVLVDNIKKEDRSINIVVSSLQKIISLEDAQRRGIPVKQYQGSLFAHFPENQKKFDKLRREEIKTFDEESPRVFEADVVLNYVKNDYWQAAYYIIKNVEVPADRLEIIENLIDGSQKERHLEQITVLKDITIRKNYNKDETPLPSGHYQIELTIPTSGRDRGHRIYSIISDEERALKEQRLRESLEEEKSSPYQQELAKTATLMKGLVGGHRDQQGLNLYAVKDADGWWRAYVGEPFHLQPLKGFKSLSRSETVNGLIKILKEAGY